MKRSTILTNAIYGYKTVVAIETTSKKESNLCIEVVNFGKEKVYNLARVAVCSLPSGVEVFTVIVAGGPVPSEELIATTLKV